MLEHAEGGEPEGAVGGPHEPALLPDGATDVRGDGTDGEDRVEQRHGQEERHRHRRECHRADAREEHQAGGDRLPQVHGGERDRGEEEHRGDRADGRHRVRHGRVDECAEARERREGQPQEPGQDGEAARRERQIGRPRHDVVEHRVGHAEQPDADHQPLDGDRHEPDRQRRNVEEQVAEVDRRGQAGQAQQAEERDAGEPDRHVGRDHRAADGGEERAGDDERREGEAAREQPVHGGEVGVRAEVEDIERPDPAEQGEVPDRDGQADERLRGEPPPHEARRHERDRRQPGVAQEAVDRGVCECRVHAPLGELEAQVEQSERLRQLERDDPGADGQRADAERRGQPQNGGHQEAGRRAVGSTGQQRASLLGRLGVRAQLLGVRVDRHRVRPGLRRVGVGRRVGRRIVPNVPATRPDSGAFGRHQADGTIRTYRAWRGLRYSRRTRPSLRSLPMTTISQVTHPCRSIPPSSSSLSSSGRSAMPCSSRGVAGSVGSGRSSGAASTVDHIARRGAEVIGAR